MIRAPTMLTLPRRFLCLCALLFWQGGFTFYAAVVVPAAGKVLAFDLHLRARITDQAVTWLNLSGVVVLALLLWDLLASGQPLRPRPARAVCWAAMAVTLAVLFFLHYWLKLLDPLDGSGPTDRAAFVAVHSVYLSTSTLQWLAALVWLALSLAAWRREDTAARSGAQPHGDLAANGPRAREDGITAAAGGGKEG